MERLEREPGGAALPPDARRRARLRSAFGPGSALRAVEAVVGGFALVLLMQAALGFNVFDGAFWSRFQRSLWQGFWGTLYYSAIILPLSLGVGFLAGWARISRYRALSWPVSASVDLIRGVPPLILAIFAFIVIPTLLPPELRTQGNSLLFAAIALALHSAAYQAEIFRAGFQSIPRGQLEAAHALGLSRGTIMRSILLPQAFRLSLPPLANEFSTLIKDTSLLGAIGATEMVALGYEFNQQILVFGVGQLSWMFAVWATVSLLYFVLTFGVTRVVLLVEMWYRVPGMEAPAA
ncbi:MAG TPA: amino acid ABC transporter permease [Thermoplasmata archaeon]|jgi:polar amino acid transport system permease protein|nr:amino acid ABC transporter permease [Thermoplasmata archaeon]